MVHDSIYVVLRADAASEPFIIPWRNQRARRIDYVLSLSRCVYCLLLNYLCVRPSADYEN